MGEGFHHIWDGDGFCAVPVEEAIFSWESGGESALVNSATEFDSRVPQISDTKACPFPSARLRRKSDLLDFSL